MRNILLIVISLLFMSCDLQVLLTDVEYPFAQEEKQLLNEVFNSKVSLDNVYVASLANGNRGVYNTLLDKIVIDYDNIGELEVITHELIHRIQWKHGYISEDEAYRLMYISELWNKPEGWYLSVIQCTIAEYKAEWRGWLNEH